MGFNTKNHHCKGGDCMCVGGELRVVRDGKLILEEGAVVEDPTGLLGGGSGGASSIPIFAKNTMTRDQMIQLAKENREHFVLIDNYWSNIGKAWLAKVDAYSVQKSDEKDPCDPCGNNKTFYRLFAYRAAGESDATAWKIEITREECEEIYAAWKVLAGVSE